MGRPRKHNRHLPPRMYLRRGAYYFAHPDGIRWIPLGKNQAEAFRKYGDHMASHLDGETMASVFARYRLEVVPKHAAATQRGNLQQITRLELVFGHMSPTSITAQHAYAYLDARKESPYAANREVELLAAVMRYAVQWGYIAASPIVRIRKHSEKARDRYLTREEYERAYALAPPVLQVAMDLAVLTGQRQAAILSLTVSDARPDGLYMRGVKKGRPVVVAWTPLLREAVERAKALRHGKATTMLLPARRGSKGLSASGFQTAWQRFMAAVVAAGGERFTFHDLRAVAADRASDPVRLLGHTSAATTERHYLRGPRKVDPTG